MSDTIKKRLDDLDNNTTGELALGTVTTKNGWQVRTLPSEEKIASVGIDYTANTDFTWSEANIAYLIENLPTDTFTSVNSCDAKVIDISPNTTYKNSMIVGVKEFFSTTTTDKIGIIPMETSFGDSYYAMPSKLHIVWTVRGV